MSCNFEDYKSSITSSLIRNCSQIVAYNDTAFVSHWKIEYYGTIIYESGKCSEWKTTIIDLRQLNLPPKSLIRLKVDRTGDNSYYSEDILVYIPSSDTVYYKSVLEGNPEYLYCCATVTSPLSPPVLKCSSVTVYNDSRQWTKYELRLPNSDSAFYSSRRCRLNSTWTLNLLDIPIIPGTQFILHAGVIAGADCDGYVVIEYDPTITTASTAKFTLVGNAFYTGLFFEGVN